MYRHRIYILVEDDEASDKMKHLMNILDKCSHLELELKQLLKIVIEISIIPSHKVMDELGFKPNVYTHIIHMTRSSWNTLLYGVAIALSSTVACRAIVHQQAVEILDLLSISYKKSYTDLNNEKSSKKPKK